MSKTLVCASLAACMQLPAAAAETWHFEYRGFYDSAGGVFLADRTLTGSFTGWDDDGDGVVARGEISSLVLNGFDYVACESQSNEYWHCGAELFSYALGGALAFSAGEYGSDPEGWVGGGHSFTAGDREYEYHYRPEYYEEWSYLWTADTTFWISPAPEPSAWALLLAGLPAAAYAARRRKK